jgi:alpha-glucosidase
MSNTHGMPPSLETLPITEPQLTGRFSPTEALPAARLWWQDGVIYQVYPRSFQDTTGDGVGDLPGILARLDYLVALGIDAVWISPFYPSPMADFGYDVSDYTDVDPLFGTLDDFDRLVEGIHERGMKLILDFVPNHTSEQHSWFLDSKRSRKSKKRDWYLWRDPAPVSKANDGPPESRPPNNWMSHFGGSAWTYDEATGQFYCHSFLKQQPDLNWRNPEVRAAVYDAMRFWLERGPGGRGVDGFRMDVLWLLIKDDQFRNNLANPEWHPGDSSFWSVLPTYTADQPETHEIVAEMRALLDQYAATGEEPTPRVLIGEIYLPLADLVRYYGLPGPGAGRLSGAQMPFNFQLIQTPWSAEAIGKLIEEYEGLLPSGAWPNWVLGNHDQPRVASRIGTDQARVAMMLLLTLRGTPTMYYGDEIGMMDGRIAPDQVQDPAEKNQPGIGQGRDPERTPMLWDHTPQAGFTTAIPWLPVNEDYPRRSVEAQQRDPRSMLHLTKDLLHLRSVTPALHAGDVSHVFSSGYVLSYRRNLGTERLQILLNLSGTNQSAWSAGGRILRSTNPWRPTEITSHVWGDFEIWPNEGLILELD